MDPLVIFAIAFLVFVLIVIAKTAVVVPQQSAFVVERLAAGAVGVAELRGSRWTARNDDVSALEPGTRARVERVEGLVLHVRREN